MLQRTLRRAGSTNRYTDGSGRKLESDIVPRELYPQPISNRAYPVQGEHWQPVVLGRPSPHKGQVVISGTGVVGLTLGALFSLRGWHTTVLGKSPALRSLTVEHNLSNPEEGKPSPQLRVVGPDGDTARNHSPSLGLEYALLTRRALDVLSASGVRLEAIRPYGTPVSGVLDHPGDYNSFLTHGLTEHHPFALRMLAVDLFRLRRHLETHLQQLPNTNVQVFNEQVIEAVHTLRQQVVVVPYASSTQATNDTNPNEAFMSVSGRAPPRTPQEWTNETVSAVQRRQRRRLDTSLTLNPLKWGKKFAADAVDYDLLVCAEGPNSHLRDLMDVEGFAADVDMSVRWFLLRTTTLSHTHVHRWLHRRQTAPLTTAASYHLTSALQVPMALAFPRVESSDLFAVMVYLPAGEFVGLGDADVLRRFLPDVSLQDPAARLVSSSVASRPSPTIYCENLYNSVGLPSAVVVGDAAHSCHPFWMQGLSVGLEDGMGLLQQVDAYSRHFYDAVKQYSHERGVTGDAVRELTERCLFYQQRKHRNPLIRLRNLYARRMHDLMPETINNTYDTSTNYLFAKSIEEMLNGRGYTSYDFAEKQQAKHNRFFHFGRLYT